MGTNTRKLEGFIATFEYREQELSFFVSDESDTIQRHHTQGSFYEQDELNVISRHFSEGEVFVDVGANVGNHTVFVSRFLSARETIVFEANPTVLPILKANIALNRLKNVDTSFLGKALSNEPAHASIVSAPRNLGGARLSLAADHQGVPVVPGDSLLSGRRVDFLKIDVEGWEMNVLRGLQKTVMEHRPRIFIEVDNPNAEDFFQWVSANRYVCIWTTKRQDWTNPPLSQAGYENFLLVPMECQ